MTTPDNITTQGILIDLSESQSATRFEGRGERLLQQTALKQVNDIIKELLDKIDKLKNAPSTSDGAYPRSHDVITINGERGSGKTTFILNILGLVSTEAWCKGKGRDYRIKSLDIIDPTLIEDCEHIFLAVISKIKEAVERCWEDTRIGSNADTVDERHAQWRNSLTKLAGGLRNLGKKKDTDGDAWADPQFIMEEGLENAAQGVKLERHFHCFVEESLKFIEKDAFIIALDDVDTKVETGWPVLEVLRKYLTTPRLIVILSGDIELYTQLIFNQQCKQAGVNPEKIIEKTQDSEGQIALDYSTQRRLVDDLTEQYMMKILRPDYRIEMQTVAQITKQLKREGKDVKVIRKQGDMEREIREILEDFCEKIYGSNFQKEYLALVLAEVPTRTCIQLLNTATSFLAEKTTNRRNTPLTKEEKALLEKARLEAVASLGHVFQNALALAGLPSKLVNEVEAQNYMTLGRLAVALKKKDLLGQGFHLFPDQAMAWQRQLMMVLGAVYTRLQTKQPGFPFGYLVSMCFPAYLQRILEDKEFKKYMTESRLDTEQEAINAVRRGIKYLLAGDIVQLKPVEIGNDDKASHPLCAITAHNCPTTPSWHRYLLNMISVFVPEGNTSRHYISFHTLLGAIATLSFSIKRPKNEKKLEPREKREVEESVLKIFRQYGGENNLQFGDPSHIAGTMKEKNESLSEFCELFARWCYTLPEDPAPLLIITESWSRFEEVATRLAGKYNNDDIENEDNEKKSGHYLQRCIIYYLSNLLEYEMSIFGIKAGSGNPPNIEVKFVNLLNAYFEQKIECPLFNYIFSCPIWMHFINLDGQQYSPSATIFNHYAKCLAKMPQGATPKNIASFTVGNDPYNNLFHLMNTPKPSSDSPGGIKQSRAGSNSNDPLRS